MNIIADVYENINYSMFGINSTHGSVVEPLGIYKEVTKLIDCEPLCGKGLWALNKSNAMFAMKRKVADVLWKNTSKREFWSVKNCLVGSGNTELRRNKNGVVLFGNVNLCKSPHICPYCSYRISVKRSIEVAQVVSWAYVNNYIPVLITLTHQHSLDMSPSTCIKVHQKALTYFYNNMSAGKKLKKMSVGRITGSEILHGVNGCHFHSHILFLMRPDYYITQKEVAESWVKALKAEKGGNLKSGSIASMLKNSVHIMENCHTSEYLSKWGVEKELTASHAKSGEGESIFSLAMNGNSGLFVKYARALKGRSRVKFSKGLRSLVGLDEKKSDSDLIEEEIKESQLMAIINREVWFYLLKHNLIADCKYVAEQYGYMGLKAWFANLELPESLKALSVKEGR